MENVFLFNHPLIQHKLTHMRDKNTDTPTFRRLLSEVSMLMTYEVTRDFPLESIEIETPLMKTSQPILAGKKLSIISILRAGNGLLDGMLKILPHAKIGYIGLYRDHDKVIEYYYKLPFDVEHRDCILVDPMLATGNSIVSALESIYKQSPPKSLRFLCLLATPAGIENVHKHFPDVEIFTAAIDPELNEKNYILPGLGDAGDRIFGTQ